MNVGVSGIETETWLHVLMVGSFSVEDYQCEISPYTFFFYTIVIISKNSNFSISCIVY